VLVRDLNIVESFMCGGITQRATSEVIWFGSSTSCCRT